MSTATHAPPPGENGLVDSIKRKGRKLKQRWKTRNAVKPKKKEKKASKNLAFYYGNKLEESGHSAAERARWEQALEQHLNVVGAREKEITRMRAKGAELEPANGWEEIEHILEDASAETRSTLRTDLLPDYIEEDGIFGATRKRQVARLEEITDEHEQVDLYVSAEDYAYADDDDIQQSVFIAELAELDDSLPQETIEDVGDHAADLREQRGGDRSRTGISHPEDAERQIRNILQYEDEATIDEIEQQLLAHYMNGDSEQGYNDREQAVDRLVTEYDRTYDDLVELSDADIRQEVLREDLQANTHWLSTPDISQVVTYAESLRQTGRSYSVDAADTDDMETDGGAAAAPAVQEYGTATTASTETTTGTTTGTETGTDDQYTGTETGTEPPSSETVEQSTAASDAVDDTGQPEQDDRDLLVDLDEYVTDELHVTADEYDIGDWFTTTADNAYAHVTVDDDWFETDRYDAFMDSVEDDAINVETPNFYFKHEEQVNEESTDKEQVSWELVSHYAWNGASGHRVDAGDR